MKEAISYIEKEYYSPKEHDLPKAEVEEYKRLVDKSLSYNNRDCILGSTIDHKFVLLSKLFRQTWHDATRNKATPQIVRMLISDKIDITNNTYYKEYLKYLDKSLNENVLINILLLNNSQEIVNKNLAILKGYSHRHKDLIRVRVESNKIENITYYKGKSFAENNFNFEIFGNNSYRVELLQEGKISICNFNNEKKVASLAQSFDKAFHLATPKNIIVGVTIQL